MPRADEPSSGNEILCSWQIAVFTAQALLGLTLFKCLLCDWEKTLLSAVRCTPHRQCSGALTLLVLKVVTGCHCPSSENLSSPLAVFSQQEKTAKCCYWCMTEILLWHLEFSTQAIISTWRFWPENLSVTLWHTVLKDDGKDCICQLLYIMGPGSRMFLNTEVNRR